ncbi:MAG: hypothetical protein JW841_05080 [Deltaproteobacteria bacterium]|nr:hypothetical protein [Deltaproteobacteria bacterium]
MSLNSTFFLRRINTHQFDVAAIASTPHPAIAPESAMTEENRVLELRLYWGDILLGINYYNKSPMITIGETKNTQIFISSEGLPTQQFPLIRYRDGEYFLTFTNQMDGEVELAGNVIKFDVLSQRYGAQQDGDFSNSYKWRLAPTTRAIVHWGGLTIAMQFVPPPNKLTRSLWGSLDYKYLNIGLMVLILHLIVMISLLLHPYDAQNLMTTWISFINAREKFFT